jgi:quinol monooxygenase YgiN
MVTVVWDTWLKAGTEVEGLRLTRQVWSDMRGFEGYISHQILVDQDAPGHIIVLGRWRSREDADQVREKYKDSETIRQLTPLLARPRERWVTSEDEPTAAESGAAPGCEQLRRQLENERWDRFLNFTPEVPTEVTV